MNQTLFRALIAFTVALAVIILPVSRSNVSTATISGATNPKVASTSNFKSRSVS